MASIEQLEKDFKNLVKNKSLSHGYILYGGSLSQELEFSRSLANYLESKKWDSPQTVLVDALVINGTQEKLGVDMARTFSDFLYKQPVTSERRTLIVHSAGELTPQAQNAILKIAEEPPAHSLIILTVKNLNVLLPPLLSRFQKIAFPESRETEKLTPAESEARELVEKFLLSSEKGRSDLIKNLIVSERDIEAKGEKVVDHFVRYLIIELHKDPEANWRGLKHLLHRFSMMSDFQTNKRLQLESVLQFLK